MEQNPTEPPVTNSIRPTYGAYTSNTLPRGPYLQYKYSDDGRAHLPPQPPPHNQRLLGPAGQQMLLQQSNHHHHQYRQQQLSLATKYATIASSKSMTHQRQHQQQEHNKQHPEPQLMRDNNNLGLIGIQWQLWVGQADVLPQRVLVTIGRKHSSIIRAIPLPPPIT